MRSAWGALFCEGGAHLSPLQAFSRQLFTTLLQLLPETAATTSELQLAYLWLLLLLAESNFAAVEHWSEAVSQASAQSAYAASSLQFSQQGNGHAAGGPAAGDVARSLKGWLLSANRRVQVAACQLLAALASRAPPALAGQLIAADVCEYLFEVLRGCSQRQSAGNGSRACEGTAGLAAVCDEELQLVDALQGAAVTALRYLALQGESNYN